MRNRPFRSPQRMAPSLTRFRSKTFPMAFVCSVCGKRTHNGRRRMVKGDSTFICKDCLHHALFLARERASHMERLRNAEESIRSNPPKDEGVSH